MVELLSDVIIWVIFASDTGFYVGLYHLPLLGMSIYALLSSRRSHIAKPECMIKTICIEYGQ